jgi:hypothetical protein
MNEGSKCVSMTWRATYDRPYRGGATVVIGDAVFVDVDPGIAAQVEIESKGSKRFIIIQCQALGSKCFQFWLDRVSLHRPTPGAQAPAAAAEIPQGAHPPTLARPAVHCPASATPANVTSRTVMRADKSSARVDPGRASVATV